jgi:chromosome segregation ATPase
MLRSENIQVRSQLSTIQRRMFQEKQQLMDYLRQIESELVEKEQIKQREHLLRQEYEELQSLNKKDRKEIEQLNNAINQDRVKIQELEEECSHLLQAIQTKDENNIQLQSELDKYTSTTKRLYTQFQVPFDVASSLDQLIPLLEEQHRTDRSAQVSASLLTPCLRRVCVSRFR